MCEQDRAHIVQRVPHRGQAGAQGRQPGLGAGIDQRDPVGELQHVHPDDLRAAPKMKVHNRHLGEAKSAGHLRIEGEGHFGARFRS